MFVTNTDRVRAELEQRIVAGVLAPGATLDEARLGQMFDVSRTPVREALLQLSAEGFVRIVPRAGIYVVQLTAAELADMFETLAHDEGLCARLVCQRLTSAGVRNVREIHQSGQRAVENNDIQAYREYVLNFHESLYESCGNRYLAARMLHTRKRVNPYRQRFTELSANWVQQSWAFHQDLFGAIKGRSAEKASACATQYILAQAQPFFEMAATTPDYLFFGDNKRSSPEKRRAEHAPLFLPRAALKEA
jgi:DNA-binding GntR family transcriptional regulator